MDRKNKVGKKGNKEFLKNQNFQKGVIPNKRKNTNNMNRRGV